MPLWPQDSSAALLQACAWRLPHHCATDQLHGEILYNQALLRLVKPDARQAILHYHSSYHVGSSVSSLVYPCAAEPSSPMNL